MIQGKETFSTVTLVFDVVMHAFGFIAFLDRFSPKIRAATVATTASLFSDFLVFASAGSRRLKCIALLVPSLILNNMAAEIGR